MTRNFGATLLLAMLVACGSSGGGTSDPGGATDPGPTPDTLAGTDTAVEEDVPIATDTPIATDVPVPGDVPATTDAPIPEDVPATIDVPIPEDVPATIDVPIPEDVPVSADVPVPEDVPATIDVPVPEDVPVTTDVPVPEDATVPACPFVGSYTISQFVCGGTDVTATISALITSIQIVIEDGTNGGCHVHSIVGNAGCTETEEWDLVPTGDTWREDKLGITGCSPDACTFVEGDAACVVGDRAYSIAGMTIQKQDAGLKVTMTDPKEGICPGPEYVNVLTAVD